MRTASSSPFCRLLRTLWRVEESIAGKKRFQTESHSIRIDDEVKVFKINDASRRKMTKRESARDEFCLQVNNRSVDTRFSPITGFRSLRLTRVELFYLLGNWHAVSIARPLPTIERVLIAQPPNLRLKNRSALYSDRLRARGEGGKTSQSHKDRIIYTYWD